MDYKLGNICHIEIPARDLAQTKKFYSETFAWKFMPMSDTYEFFDTGNMTGAFDTDAKPSHDGTILVLAVEDIDEKLAQIEIAGGKTLKPKTAIADGHGHYAYFSDPSGNRMGIWTPT